ncbi:ASST-domain-containing protein [Mycena vulgaris]|nr:ASST-domain-containing protein [Mycena vulgaris]
MTVLYRLLTLGAALQKASASFVSRPDLDPTAWNISYVAPDAELADGYVFLAPRKVDPSGLIIFTGDGDLVYLNNDTWLKGAFDFRPQTFNNDQYLTFWAGTASTAGYGKGRVFMMDHDYNVVYNFTATNQSDFHEFHINADGSALTTAYNPVDGIDTTGKSYGQSNSYVVDGCFQELNITSGEPTFTFCSLENGISIWDSYVDPSMAPNSTENAWDYCHVNSIEKDALGNYLLSARHTHTLYYIEGSSGEILWRLGGKNSTFTGDGTYFSWQHDARWVGETNFTAAEITDANTKTRRISVYDNAATSWVSESTESRGLLIEINFQNSTATLITPFDAPGGQTLLSTSQGNLQLLSDASYTTSTNVIMGYGQLPVFAEYTSTGTPLRVVSYAADEAQGYRVFKNSWVGTPVTAPDVAIQNNAVYVSWNGATEVAQWSLMQGDAMDSWSNVTNVTRAGFETSIALGSAKVVQLAALDANGAVLAKSNALSVDGTSMGGAVNGSGSASGTAAANSPSSSAGSESGAHDWNRRAAVHATVALAAIVMISNIC